MSLLHKTENQQRNNDPLFRLMTPMIAGVLACVFCLVSMTWAWFTASVNTPTQTLQAATQFTKVKVYEVVKSENENDVETRTLVKTTEDSKRSLKEVSLIEELETDKDISIVTAEEPLVWELSPEKSYEVVMTGGGTASKGYCKVALSHTESGSDTPETKLYQTSAFEKDNTVQFTYNTGGFSEKDGVTATQWKEYVEKTTPPTLTIASFWGEPAEDATAQVSLMSARNMAEEEIMLLSDGDVIGFAPIPCPAAKAETEIELEGFEIREGAVISAEEDYKISLALKEGYEMPSEVVVNIGGKDYVVSTGGAEISEDAPYYDAEAGVLTVPSALLSDGTTVSVKATATQVPAEEETEEEKTEEEATEETTEEAVEEIAEETAEDTTDNNETEEDNSADAKSDDTVVADDPAKKEEDEEGKLSVKPVKTPSGSGGKGDDNDGDDDKEDNNSGDSSVGDTSSPDNNEEETEVEKADVTLNLSQLTINLEETKIPTNADLVLTLSAKEDMELPEEIAITLDKTIRDENTEDEEIQEDKTEYIVNTAGRDNPEGFAFDTESGKLTISSELLKGVREITIADIEQSEETEEEKAEISFEVKNLTFDFTDDEIVTDEDVVITFTAGEEYELPETILITIDGEEYIVYTSAEASEPNPVGITFDAETGTLTISKDLLEDVKAITITAEGVKKEDEEENPDGDDKKDEPADKEPAGEEKEPEGSEGTDKETENGSDNTQDAGKTEPEGGEGTNPETNPDDTTTGEDEGETEAPESGTETPEPTTPDTEDNSGTASDGENVGTEGAGEDATENGTEETTQPTPDAESGDNDETTPNEPIEPIVTPETAETDAPSASKPEEEGMNGNAGTGSIPADNTNQEEKESAGDTASSEAPPLAPAVSGDAESLRVSNILMPETNKSEQ